MIIVEYKISKSSRSCVLAELRKKKIRILQVFIKLSSSVICEHGSMLGLKKCCIILSHEN